jgi:hypothetical protein
MSGCAVSADALSTPDFDRTALAEIVAGQLVAEPEEGDNGLRPPTAASGWLSNGRRSPDAGSGAAMSSRQWEAPREHGRGRHSVFLDAELWAAPVESAGSLGPAGPSGAPAAEREWSCAFLRSVWQLLRLGVLRDGGRAVARAHPWDPAQDWPAAWPELPTVVRLAPDATPFPAYRALSVLPDGFLSVEHAVRVVLEHVRCDETAVAQVLARARRESVAVPAPLVGRLGYVFLDAG